MAKSGFEGMDSQDDYHLNEQQEKRRVRKDSLIWFAIAVVAAGFLIWNIYEHYQMQKVLDSYTAVEGTYHAAAGTVWYEDASGKLYKVEITNDRNLKDEDKITVYYDPEYPHLYGIEPSPKGFVIEYVLLSAVVVGAVFMGVRRIIKG